MATCSSLVNTDDHKCKVHEGDSGSNNSSGMNCNQLLKNVTTCNLLNYVYILHRYASNYIV